MAERRVEPRSKSMALPLPKGTFSLFVFPGFSYFWFYCTFFNDVRLYPMEGNNSMSESAENAPAQGSVQRNKRRLLLFCGVILLNVGLLVLLFTQLLTSAPANSVSDPLLGHPAPNFSLTILRPSTGKSTLSPGDFQGKAMVLNFWASWCQPCKEETPLLERTWKQTQAQGKEVVFVGIDFEESTSAATSFLQHYGVTYPVVLDVDGSVATHYRVVALPATIFINRKGIVVSKVSRQITAQVLASNLQLIL
jgi:thiol-disulfide isomerase/thioredoxin